MHAEYTIRAHRAGKHVLVEKPMANTPADCQAMIDAARAASRRLMVAYRCRYEPFNREMIRMARESRPSRLTSWGMWPEPTPFRQPSCCWPERSSLGRCWPWALPETKGKTLE
jgi:predicted dehydrogenase